MNYQDFEIALTTDIDGNHHVNVVRTPAGETHQKLAIGLSDDELHGKLQALETVLRQNSDGTSDIGHARLQAVKEIGSLLFNALFNTDLKSTYDQSTWIARSNNTGLRLSLRIQSPLLAAAPWELLYDTRFDAFLATSSRLSIVRYVPLPRPPQLLATKPPLNVLGIVSSPRDLSPLDVLQEKQQVAIALQPLITNQMATLTWLEQPNWRALLRAMRQGPWHVLHFIGHSGFDINADEGYIDLEDRDGNAEHLAAGQLATLLQDHGTLRLVILNACKGARIGADIFSSTATTLVQRGIPAVIGMQYDISDAAAIEFAQTFYELLAENVPIETAVAEARKALSLALDTTVEWGTPVYYTHAPDSILFDMIDAAPATATVSGLDRLVAGVDRAYDVVDEVDKLVSTVRRLAPQLKMHPDSTAYSDLTAALDEVTKTWEVTDGAFAEVWHLYKANGDLKDASEGLLEIGDFRLRRKVAAGRGHCHKISDIYDRRLKSWIASNNNLAEADKTALEEVFTVLKQADGELFDVMVDAAQDIEKAANQVLQLVEDEQPDAARDVARSLRRTVSPLRTAINRSLVVVSQLQAEFTEFTVSPAAIAPGTTGSAWDNNLSREFHACLIDAFNHNSLEAMLLFGLNERLYVIVEPGSFYKVTFDLIVFALEKGWILELVAAAHKHNKTNQKLAAFAERVRMMQVTRPTTSSGSEFPETAQSTTSSIDAWVQALEQSPSMQNRDTRQAVIAELPSQIRNALNSNLPTLTTQLRDMVKTCLNYENGLSSLVTAIRALEGDSLAVQQLESLL